MSEKFIYISRIEIKNLWHRFDIAWDLNPDVNVLSGINGSGKSTILNAISQLIINYNTPDKLDNIQQDINIFLSDNTSVGLQFIDARNSLHRHLLTDKMNKLGKFNREIITTHSLDDYKVVLFSNEYDMSIKTSNGSKKFYDLFLLDYINTFDNQLKKLDDSSRLSNENVLTELDWQIFLLMNKYLSYQLSISKKLTTDVEANKYHNKFLEILNSLFQETGKWLNQDKNEISFLSGGEEIAPYQLSSGEKQMLVILLTVLIQDCKPAVLFLDEPEISLHFDWQKKLIQYIRELNPNVQVILATHSPAVIMEGWVDKVSEVRDLITLDRKAAN